MVRLMGVNFSHRDVSICFEFLGEEKVQMGTVGEGYGERL